ncbi:uncharacterized protein LOC119084614 [Bradysia coprophila]|uniref:uncharacterized protein LOC119084614 n=1 Tax=Bradysia coprophila TaxID=38358 RepID=UPI00187DB4CC|nr:uncharacterized protein LOC119084614 [Bradysia coprophila]
MKFFVTTLSIVLLSVVWTVVADVSVINVPAKVLEDETVSSKVPTEVSADQLPTEVSSENPDTVSSKLPEVSSETVETDSTELPSEISDENAILCGAAGSCQGIGGGALCHDRCRQCSGPSGPYTRGACCGTLWLTCCCYYN